MLCLFMPGKYYISEKALARIKLHSPAAFHKALLSHLAGDWSESDKHRDYMDSALATGGELVSHRMVDPISTQFVWVDIVTDAERTATIIRLSMPEKQRDVSRLRKLPPEFVPPAEPQIWQGVIAIRRWLHIHRDLLATVLES